MQHLRAVEVVAAGGRGEAGRAVGSQQPLLVLPVLELGVGPRALLERVVGEPGAAQQVVVEILLGIPGPMVAAGEAVAQLVDDALVRLALAQRLHGLRDGAERVGLVAGDADALREARGGQQHVGAGERRGGEEQVHHHVELHLLQRGQDALRLGAHAGDGVVLHHEHGLDGVGLARLHGLEQHVGADGGHGLERRVLEVHGASLVFDRLGAPFPYLLARHPCHAHIP